MLGVDARADTAALAHYAFRGRSSDPTPATSRHGESPRARQRKAIHVPDEEGSSDVYEPDVGLEELDALRTSCEMCDRSTVRGDQ